MPAKKDMPSTVARSSKKARDTWGKTHDAAVDQYGEGKRAHRTAFASLKHTHEKWGTAGWTRAGRALGRPGGEDRCRGPTRRPHRGWGRCQGQQGAPARRRQAARRPRPQPDDQGRVVEAIGRANDRATARARR